MESYYGGRRDLINPISIKQKQTIPPSIRGVVFDLDGTLVDSAPVLRLILNNFRKQRGLQELKLECYKKWSSVGGLTLIQNALEVEGAEAEKLLIEFRKKYAQIPTPSESIYGGVTFALKKLQDKNIQMAICSNKPMNLCQKVLKDFDLLSFFSTIIAGDTLEVKKPEPQTLWHAAKGMGMTVDHILFVGDSIVDFETAKRANSKFMIFEGGYHEGVDMDACDYRLPDYSKLPALF